MLLANKFVAESVGKVKKGTKAKTLPYRIHDQPDPTKLETLREFVVKFGYKAEDGRNQGCHLQEPEQSDGRLPGKERTETHRDGGTACHDEGEVLDP